MGKQRFIIHGVEEYLTIYIVQSSHLHFNVLHFHIYYYYLFFVCRVHVMMVFIYLNQKDLHQFS